MQACSPSGLVLVARGRAWIVVMLIAVEIVLTAWDFVQEDRSRVLSPVERIPHLVLSMSGGAYVGLLIPNLQTS